MSKTGKIGIIIILIGICLPTATLPFISEFHPVPNICLTSNFFGNLGNMVITLGGETAAQSMDVNYNTGAVIPYKYLFASGVILTLLGIGVVTLSGSCNNKPQD